MKFIFKESNHDHGIPYLDIPAGAMLCGAMEQSEGSWGGDWICRPLPNFDTSPNKHKVVQGTKANQMGDNGNGIFLVFFDSYYSLSQQVVPTILPGAKLWHMGRMRCLLGPPFSYPVKLADRLQFAIGRCLCFFFRSGGACFAGLVGVWPRWNGQTIGCTAPRFSRQCVPRHTCWQSDRELKQNKTLISMSLLLRWFLDVFGKLRLFG